MYKNHPVLDKVKEIFSYEIDAIKLYKRGKGDFLTILLMNNNTFELHCYNVKVKNKYTWKIINLDVNLQNIDIASLGIVGDKVFLASFNRFMVIDYKNGEIYHNVVIGGDKCPFGKRFVNSKIKLWVDNKWLHLSPSDGSSRLCINLKGIDWKTASLGHLEIRSANDFMNNGMFCDTSINSNYKKISFINYWGNEPRKKIHYADCAKEDCFLYYSDTSLYKFDPLNMKLMKLKWEKIQKKETYTCARVRPLWRGEN